MDINWVAVEAIGSILAAFTTTGAVLVALYQSGIIFKEQLRIDLFIEDDLLISRKDKNYEYTLTITNIGVRPIYINFILFDFGRKSFGICHTADPLENGEEKVMPGDVRLYSYSRDLLIKLAEDNISCCSRKAKLRVGIETTIKSYFKKTEYELKEVMGWTKSATQEKRPKYVVQTCNVSLVSFRLIVIDFILSLRKKHHG